MTLKGLGHTQNSQGQILALAFMLKSQKRFKTPCSLFARERLPLPLYQRSATVRAPWAYAGLGLSVWGAGFMVQGSGFRVQGSGLRVHGFGFRDSSLGICSLEVLHWVEGRVHLFSSFGLRV